MVANAFYNPAGAAAAALGVLRWNSVLANLVYRDVESGFVPGAGAVVNVRNPISAGVARTYTDTLRQAGTPIVLDALSETTLPVTLDTHLYKAIPISDEDLTLNIGDFTRQVLRPQVESVADGAEASIATTLATLPAATAGTTVAADGSNALDVLREARRILNSRQVPLIGRVAIVGTRIASDLLGDDRLIRADASGSTGALREAVIGRVLGMDVVESTSVDEDFGVVMTPEAVAFVSRPPANPRGATASESVSLDGFTMRWLQDYDPAFMRDRSIVSTFVGSTVLDANRAVRLDHAAA